MKKFFLVVFLFAFMLPLSAQQQTQDDYMKVLTERADKIVKTLNITDSLQYKRVREILVNQYAALGKIHDASDAKIKALKSSGLSKEELEKQTKAVENEADAQLYQWHCAYFAQLSGNLTAGQVEAVKNGMTYNVLNVTFNAQLDMIPTLKADEKRQIMIWLLEAREHAIDASSADGKHAWFGKYKGRINNYLSSCGYDLTKERAAWAERIKQRSEK
jgi:hypothetical protein